MKKSFSTVKDWIDAGGLATGHISFDGLPCRETEKAVAFAVHHHNSSRDNAKSACWFPKSHVQKVLNDFYSSAPEFLYLVPEWLVNKKRLEGFDL